VALADIRYTGTRLDLGLNRLSWDILVRVSGAKQNFPRLPHRERGSPPDPEMAAPAADEAWCRETVPRVMELVSPRLPQRDACGLLAVSPWCYRALVANSRLWEVRVS
jgi:F-box/leucine-rich repeat protein 2/20